MKDVLIEATYHGKVAQHGNSKMVLIPAFIVEEMDLEVGSRIVVMITRPKIVYKEDDE